MKERNLYPLMNLPPEITKCGGLEVKMTKNGRFRFESVEKHQIKWLKQAQIRVLGRIDDSIGGIGRQKPFDFYMLVSGLSYIAICFYKPRKPKILYWITLDTFLKAEKTHNKRSLKEEDCQKLADFVQTL